MVAQVATQLQLVDSLASKISVSSPRVQEKVSQTTQFETNSTLLQNPPNRHAAPKQTKSNLHFGPANLANERDFDHAERLAAAHWQRLHYATGAKLSDYAQLLADDSTPPPQTNPTLDHIRQRQRELLQLFANQFDLNAVMAKMVSTNAKLQNSYQQNATTPTTTTTIQRSMGALKQIAAPANAHHFDHLAQLACDSGEMVVRLNFTQPFKGIVYPEHNRLSPCRFFGDGHHNYELRLPLRSCGTKQVAPRVFVNDVIVRFHKTLELEEDEVKTLICRYPAPLDGQRERERLAAGNGLVHELAHPTSNRPQLEQFELIEPQGGATKTNRFGQQELFGELLAPPSAAPARHHNQLQASQTLQELQQRQRTRQQHADLMLAPPLGATKSQAGQATNSRLFELDSLAGDAVQSSSGGAGGFLDRLTSIELLFLISSLVFLALLALGLLLSYWCFWRRRRRDPLAGAPTSGRRRQLRYFNAPHLAAGTGARPLYTPTQHYSLEATPASLYHQARQQQQKHLSQQQLGASSPDDSDVSGRVLLPAAGSHHQNLMLNQREALRGQTHELDAGLRPASRHYKASTIARNALPLATGRRGRLAEPAPMSQTLGRRAQQARLTGAGYLAPNLRASKLAKSSTLNAQSSSREPLLKMAAGQLEQPSARTYNLRPSSSMQQLVEKPTELVGWQKHQQQLARFRNEHQFRQRAPARPHEHHQQQEAFVDYQHKRAQLVDINSCTSSSSASASEGELELNNNLQSDSQAHERSLEPTLILKSIEDSFVTNFTEIHEQEYRKYDNRRPFSVAEWRAKQPATSAGTGAGSASLQRRPDDKSAQEAASSSDSEQEVANSSSAAGLRSLTELDVNFAKSLPRYRPQAAAGEPQQQQQQTSEQEEGKPAADTPSPDLIISPDYNFGRFKLASDEPSRTRNERAITPGAQSQDSISYV